MDCSMGFDASTSSSAPISFASFSCRFWCPRSSAALPKLPAPRDEDLSKGITLEPGDIIATGTPEGVGAGRDPQEWLWPGDVVVDCVEGIGTIRHPVVNSTP